MHFQHRAKVIAGLGWMAQTRWGLVHSAKLLKYCFHEKNPNKQKTPLKSKPKTWTQTNKKEKPMNHHKTKQTNKKEKPKPNSKPENARKLYYLFIRSEYLFLLWILQTSNNKHIAVTLNLYKWVRMFPGNSFSFLWLTWLW